MSSENTKSPQNMVNDICNDFLRKNIKPTVRLVLAELPDTTSTSTAHKYLSIWKEKQIEKQESLFDKFGFSNEFTTSFMNEINRFSTEIEQRYKMQAQDATDQRDQAISDLEMSENLLNKQSGVVNQQEKQIKDLHTELAKEQKYNESTVIEIRKQLTTSIDDNKQLNKQNEVIRTGVAKAELKLESNQQLVDEMKSQATRLIAENKELHSNIAELNRSIASKEATILGNDKLILTLESEKEKTTKQLINFDSNNVKLQSELDSLRSELADFNTKLSNEKDKLIQQVSINNELKSNFEEQTRSHEKTLRSYEATISSNEKLIIQLDKKVQ